MEHTFLERLQGGVLIPMPQGIDDRDNTDIVFLGISDQLFPLLGAHGVGKLSRFRHTAELEHILDIRHIQVAFDAGKAADDGFKVVERGNLPPGNIVGKSPDRHRRGILHDTAGGLPFI